jgi:hypothetical protein
MAQDLEQLSVSLGAKIDDFKKGMQEAVREFNTDADSIERRNQQLTENMSRQMQSTATSARFLAGVLRTAFSVYAIQQFTSAVLDANKYVAELARTSDIARVSTV